MMRFLIDPDLLSVFHAAAGRVGIAYCGVFVPGLTVAADDDPSWALEYHLDELSAHDRLNLIGKFLAAWHPAQ
jgi:hypothetical protein